MPLEEGYTRTEGFSRQRGSYDRTPLEQALGWFSIGLGALEVVAPGSVTRGLDLPQRNDLVTGYGVREIAAGAGILMSDDPEPWLWSRVAGDVLDLATIAFGSSQSQTSGRMPAMGAAAVAGVLLLDVYAAYRRSQM